MKIIHFCSYYIGSKVYKKLFSSLSEHGVQSEVFIPIRDSAHRGINKIENDKIIYHYIKCLSIFTRLFYSLKLVKVVFNFLCNRSKSGEVIHAHTLYADGIPAYICAKLLNKKLVITLRNTDVNLGFKYFRQYKWLANLALRYSSQIIFVSPKHKFKFQSYFGSAFNSKLKVIPNGIDSFFIENALTKKSLRSSCVGVYAGEITKNKNINSAIQAFAKVNDGKSWEFHIVGGSYETFIKEYGVLPKEYSNNVLFIPKVSQQGLIEYYDNATMFIMPSHTETFGLVYIEAISRCLPVVYTKGQGIDGYFIDGSIGFSCDSSSIDDIGKAIIKTMEKYPTGLIFSGRNIATKFDWNIIVKDYVENVYNPPNSLI